MKNGILGYSGRSGNRMFIIFKKRIAIDTSGEEVRRITTVLEQNDIKYEIRTKRSRGVIGSAFDAGSYARSNIAMYKGSSTPSFVYMIYVKRKDYARAQELLFEL
jgi:hypothetical protein